MKAQTCPDRRFGAILRAIFAGSAPGCEWRVFAQVRQLLLVHGSGGGGDGASLVAEPVTELESQVVVGKSGDIVVLTHGW